MGHFNKRVARQLFIVVINNLPPGQFYSSVFPEDCFTLIWFIRCVAIAKLLC
jgi:hypothetical protein